MVINKCVVFSWVFLVGKAVGSNLHGTSIIMNLAQNVLSVLSKCVCVCQSVCIDYAKKALTLKLKPPVKEVMMLSGISGKIDIQPFSMHSLNISGTCII